MKLFKTLTLVAAMGMILTSCRDEKKSEPVEERKVEVRVQQMNTMSLNGEREYSGTIEEMNGTALSFASAGTVKSVHFSMGQRVGKGQLLAVLDDATLNNAYQTAVATLHQAQDAYNRMKQLHDKGSLPEIQWVEVQTQLQQAEYAEKIAKKSLDDSKLYAPASGMISDKSVEVGQNVMPGLSIGELVTINHVKVKIAVPENEISEVKVGQDVTFSVEALNGKTFTGRVTEKGVAANQLSHSYEVKAIVNNEKGELMPGMICKLQMKARADEPQTMMLPANTIQLDEKNRHFVWVNANGVARKRFVETGASTPEGIRINSGLNEGDQVIVEGQHRVSENMKLAVVK